ncbi:hypothetical protein B0H12DRAFT_1246341 [Mycena haematopus]|nr:hypothetical protein B0H12DRAFT_1246341 [Mycena haematopus]
MSPSPLPPCHKPLSTRRQHCRRPGQGELHPSARYSTRRSRSWLAPPTGGLLALPALGVTSLCPTIWHDEPAQPSAQPSATLHTTLRITHSDSVGRVSQAPAVVGSPRSQAPIRCGAADPQATSSWCIQRRCPACTLRQPSAPAAMLVDLDIATLIAAVPLDVVTTTLTKALHCRTCRPALTFCIIAPSASPQTLL